MRKLTLGRQLAVGFSVVLGLFVLVGIILAWKMNSVLGESRILASFGIPLMTSSGEIQTGQREAGYRILGYNFLREKDWLAQGKTQLANIEKEIRALEELATTNTSVAGNLAQALPQIKTQVASYRKEVDRAERINTTLSENIAKAVEEAVVFLKEISAYKTLQDQQLEAQIKKSDTTEELLIRISRAKAAENILTQFGQVRVDFWRAQAQFDATIAESSAEVVEKITKDIDALLAVTRQEVNKKQLLRAKSAGETVRDVLRNYATLTRESEQSNQARQATYNATLKAVASLAGDARQMVISTAKNTENTISVNLWITLAGLGSALLIGITISTMISRGLTKTLRELIEKLTAGSDQTSAAAAQVSSASQSLASGASEQAASLEETSASLEELSSMTAQNAESASGADAAMREAASRISQAASAMREMVDAIGKIQASTEETAKILKTVDEIAFQTNILALNAAVEAARAGEAGAGFAVVADEVRALAQRSANAARETTTLIANSRTNSETGVKASVLLGQLMDAIEADAKKVLGQVSQIAAVSREQNQGVAQINTAVLQIDKVTQSNASGAEETASAAEELSAQTEELKGVVKALHAIISSEHDSHSPAESAKVVTPPSTAKPTAKPKTVSAKLPASVEKPKKQLSGSSKPSADSFWES